MEPAQASPQTPGRQSSDFCWVGPCAPFLANRGVRSKSRTPESSGGVLDHLCAMPGWSCCARLKPLPTSSVSLRHSIQHFFHKSSGGIGTTWISRPCFAHILALPLMFPPDPYSLRRGDDGDLLPHDTLNLMERLTRAERESKGSEGTTLNTSPLPQDSDSADIP